MLFTRQLSYEWEQSSKPLLCRFFSYDIFKTADFSTTIQEISISSPPKTKAIVSDFQSSTPIITYQHELPDELPAGYCRVKILRSQICNSDRRVLAGTKKSGINKSIVLGHEGIGIIEKMSNQNKRNDLKIGQLVVLGPHFVEDDICLKKGLPNLCCQMKHMGIHIDGVFADKMDFPEYTLNRIVGSENILQQAKCLSDYYDQMVLIEPLACVQRGYKLLEKQDYFNINAIESVLILGAGPMGVIHAMHIQKKYPQITVTITDTDPVRRTIVRNISNLKATVVDSTHFENGIQYDLIVTATSNRKANTVDAIRLVKNNGIILLFSGIDMKETDPRPNIAGIDIETVHRYEYSVRLINHDFGITNKLIKSIYFIGTSGYVEDDFNTSIQELHDDIILDEQYRLYKGVTTSVINKLDGNIVHDLTGVFHDISFDVAAIIPLLKLYDDNEKENNDMNSNVHHHLKILIRH